MKGKIKEQQHYVWRHYLESWIVDGDKKKRLWCYEKHRVFGGNPSLRPHKKINRDKYFYEIKSLNRDEIEYFIRLCTPPIYQEMMRCYIEQQQGHIKIADPVNWVKDCLAKQFGDYDNIPKELLNQANDISNKVNEHIKNTFENEHEKIEKNALKYKWLDKLRSGCSDFFCLDDERYLFLQFVLTQHFRTEISRETFSTTHRGRLDSPKSIALLSENQIDPQKVNTNNLTNYFTMLYSLCIAEILYKSKANLTLNINETNVPFITSDHPVVGWKGPIREAPGGTFYYPISPDTAIIINCKNKPNKILVCEQEVDVYNQAIFDLAHKNVFSDTANILEKYIPKSNQGIAEIKHPVANSHERGRSGGH